MRQAIIDDLSTGRRTPMKALAERHGVCLRTIQHIAMALKQSEPSGIYFIQAGTSGPIKIGISDNIQTRLTVLQTAHFLELRLIAHCQGTNADEKELHDRFNHLRMRGEWFCPAKELVDYAKSLRENTAL